MTEGYTVVAMGTAAALLAVLLLLLRLEIGGRRMVLELAQKWVATDARACLLAVALLGAVSAYAFSFSPADERAVAGRTADASPGESLNADPELAALRAYVDKTNAEPNPAAPAPAASDQPDLPDVETMIGKLVARLEKEPGDARGWKMLGWSYLNTGRTEEAAKAYEKARALAPEDAEVKKALEAIISTKTDQTASIGSADVTTPPATAPDHAAETNTTMIRTMVDQLDKRLAASPKDEKGWQMLIRSRVMLGEPDAARAALTRAREAFAGDAAAAERLSALASEFGIESN